MKTLFLIFLFTIPAYSQVTIEDIFIDETYINVTIQFSEAMSLNGLYNPLNYQIVDEFNLGYPVYEVVETLELNSIKIIFIRPETIARFFTFYVFNVTDLVGNVINPNANSITIFIK